MKNPHDIILEPIITERSTAISYDGKYTFKVAKHATKTEIRKACEQLFSVRVLKVNTRNVPGKFKRMGATSGYTPSWKKAIVSIDTNPAPDTYLDKGGKLKESSRKYKSSIEEFGFGL